MEFVGGDFHVEVVGEFLEDGDVAPAVDFVGEGEFFSVGGVFDEVFYLAGFLADFFIDPVFPLA